MRTTSVDTGRERVASRRIDRPSRVGVIPCRVGSPRFRLGRQGQVFRQFAVVLNVSDTLNPFKSGGLEAVHIGLISTCWS